MSGVAYCAQCQQVTPDAVALCDHCGADARLDGRYRLRRVLGRGAFGTTWLAERNEDGLQVAVKEMLVRDLESFKAFDLFNREAELLRSLQHDAIPGYFDHFQAGQGRQFGLYLVTAFVDGQTLAEELKGRRYEAREVLAVLRELLEVVAWLHRRSPPVVHRDIKPANVMRRRSDGKLVLIDFGAVKGAARDVDGGGSTVAGTFGYMAPEQFAGRASAASDIYALGVLGLELATRQGPQALLDDTGALQWESSVPDAMLREVLGRMIVRDVQARASDAEVLADHIGAVLAGRSGAAAACGSPEAGVEALVAHALAAFRAVEGIDLREDQAAMGRLRHAARLAAFELTTATASTLNLPFLTADANGPRHLLLSVTRSDLAPRSTPDRALVGGTARFSGADSPGRLSGSASAHDALAARAGVLPARAEPPPMAPRSLPKRFGKRVDPRGHGLRMTGLALLVWPLVLSLVMGFGSNGLMALLSMSFGLFENLFFTVGLVLLVFGHRRISGKARIWRTGEAVPAVVTDVALNTSVRVNRRNPWVVTYRYERPDGRSAEGEIVSLEVPARYRMRGAGIWAFLDPDDTRRSVAFWD